MPGAKGTMQTVKIRPVLNGWIVEVGCATLVAIDKELMIRELSRYIDHPREVLAGNLRAQVNEGTYSPDETTREALGQPAGVEQARVPSARQAIPSDVAPPDQSGNIAGPTPETAPETAPTPTEGHPNG